MMPAREDTGDEFGWIAGEPSGYPWPGPNETGAPRSCALEHSARASDGPHPRADSRAAPVPRRLPPAAPLQYRSVWSGRDARADAPAPEPGASELLHRIEAIESRLWRLEGEARGVPVALGACTREIEDLEARLDALEGASADRRVDELLVHVVARLEDLAGKVEAPGATSIALVEIGAQIEVFSETLRAVARPQVDVRESAQAIRETARRIDRLEAKLDASAAVPDALAQLATQVGRIGEQLGALEEQTAAALRAGRPGRLAAQIDEPAHRAREASGWRPPDDSASDPVIRVFEGLPFDSGSGEVGTGGDGSARWRRFRRGDGAA